MNSKNWSLFSGITGLIVFIGYLSEVGPRYLFGFSINIWLIRLFWLGFTIAYLANYFKIKKSEKSQ